MIIILLLYYDGCTKKSYSRILYATYGARVCRPHSKRRKPEEEEPCPESVKWHGATTENIGRIPPNAVETTTKSPLTEFFFYFSTTIRWLKYRNRHVETFVWNVTFVSALFLKRLPPLTNSLYDFYTGTIWTGVQYVSCPSVDDNKNPLFRSTFEMVSVVRKSISTWNRVFFFFTMAEKIINFYSKPSCIDNIIDK